MEVSVENTSTLGRKIKVSVPDAVVREQFKQRISKFAKEAHLKGFRPGKVPSQVIEKRFGESLRMEMIEELIRQSLTDVFEEKALQVAGSPRIEEIKNESGKDLEFTAVLEVYPEISLADFKDLEIEKRQVTILDEDVNKMIEKLKDNFGEWELVARDIGLNDKVRVDFSRLLKIEEASKEEQNGVEILVKEEGSLPGLVDALLGKKAGDQFELDITYPSDWSELGVAGKSATLSITIHEVFAKKLLTEEALADKLGVTENEDETLFALVKGRMQAELDSTLREEIKEKVLEVLLEKNPIELPQALIDQEKEAIRRELSRQGKVNLPKEAMEQPEVESQARRRVELGLLLNEVIKKHQVKAEPALIMQEINKIADRFPGQREQVINVYRQNKDLLHTVERMVLLDRAVDVMLEEMKPKEITVSFDQVMNPEGKE